MSPTHYQHVEALAREVEARTPYRVFIDHKNLRLFVGPENTPWSVWSVHLFTGQGLARHFRGWKDGINADDVVKIVMLSQKDGRQKGRWATRPEPKDTRAETARHEARDRAEKAMNRVQKRRVYGLA